MIKTLRNLFKQDKEKFVVPKSVQAVIPIKTIWDGSKSQTGWLEWWICPYGYYLENNQPLIEETEVKAIRIIFEKFGNSDIGLGGVTKYLNLQGIKKIPRLNGKLETWSGHFILKMQNYGEALLRWNPLLW